MTEKITGALVAGAVTAVLVGLFCVALWDWPIIRLVALSFIIPGAAGAVLANYSEGCGCMLAVMFLCPVVALDWLLWDQDLVRTIVLSALLPICVFCLVMFVNASLGTSNVVHIEVNNILHDKSLNSSDTHIKTA